MTKKQEKLYNRMSEKLKVFEGLASTLIQGMGRIANKDLPNSHEKNGCYRFIPYNLSSAYDLLASAYDSFTLHQPTFLDCGCGIGNIAILARNIGYADVTGIEFSKKIVNVARATSGPHGCGYNSWNIIKGNILTFDAYHKYDVIYYYCPLSDYRRQGKFEDRVAKQMSVGSLVISVGSGSGRLRNNPCFKVFEKGSSMPIFRKIKEV